MFFDTLDDLLRVLVVGSLAYLAAVALLRVTGKRTLSKMNAFDLVVTVALGSTLATVLLATEVALAEGVLGLALLILLQYAVAWLSVRSAVFRSLIKARPTLVLEDGEVLHHALVRVRVAREEVLAAVRASGYASLQQVRAVVLETDGSFSVIGSGGEGPPAALENVQRLEPPPPSRSMDGRTSTLREAPQDGARL